MAEPAKNVLAQIEFEPIAMDDLLAVSSIEPMALLEILTDLELQGFVERSANGVQRLR